MMSTAPPLLLNREQAERLLIYMQQYRRSALTSMSPTQERNTTLRLIQALQGKLLAQIDQKLPQVDLILAEEDVAALKAMTKSLLLLYGKKTDSPDQAITVADVGKLYAHLKQTYG
jgi:hypothetical protein